MVCRLSPLEEAVSSEPVSEKPKFPVSRENTGNFIDSKTRERVNGNKKWHQTRALRANSLRIGTGNYLRPYREFKSAIREFSALIRES